MDAKMDNQGDIEYQYTISKGISTIQGAIKVLRDMEYPEEIINTMMMYDTEGKGKEQGKEQGKEEGKGKKKRKEKKI
jgi:DNA mismatch repair ATPase MutS